jgi:uncharacterized membrane protein YbaN (DUF454 family)
VDVPISWQGNDLLRRDVIKFMLRTGDGVETVEVNHSAMTSESGDPESQAEAQAFCLDIQIDERASSVRVYDPRAFHAGRRTFCRRLLEAAVDRPGVSRVEIDLATASCRLDFGAVSPTSQSMALAFVDAVREASGRAPGKDRTWWWSLAPGWVALTAYQLPGGASVWETLETKPGQVQLRHRGLEGDPVRPTQLADAVEHLPGVARCRVLRWSRRYAIDLDRESPAPPRFVDQVERAWEDLLAAESNPIKVVNGDIVGGDSTGFEVASGLTRLKYLAMAGGSFVLTVVGLVVPGIPTVPCLLATSYYLARSSPRLDQMLRRTAFFGPIVTEWESHRALSRWSKGKLIGLTLAIIIVTVALSALSPVALVVIVLVASISVYGLIRLPGLPEGSKALATQEQPVRLALVAP